MLNLRSTIVGGDTETYLGSPKIPGLAAPRLVCGSLDDGINAWLLDRAGSLAAFEQLLRTPGVTIVGQNFRYDGCVLAEERPKLIKLLFDAFGLGRIRDTMIRQRLINLANGTLDFDPYSKRPQKYGLSDLVKKHFQEDISATKKGEDVWRLRYSELDGVPLEMWPSEASEYAKGDSTWVRRVFISQEDVWKRQAGLDTIPGELEATCGSFALQLATCWGIRVNEQSVLEKKAELQKTYDEYKPFLLETGVMRPNGKMDIKRLEEHILRASDGHPKRKAATKKMKAKGITEGNIQRDGTTLVEYDDPILFKIAMSSRPRYHLQNTIPALMRGIHFPLNPRFNMVRGTGRTSSSGPNIQNLPRDGGYRECIVPREGWVFFCADYSQLELCTLAQVLLDLFGASDMADAIRRGEDLHLVLVSKLLGIPYEQCSKESHKEERQFCKAGNYGYPGGMGPKKFLQTLRHRIFKGELDESFHAKTIHDAELLREAWFKAWPEVREYFQHTSRLVQAGQPVIQHRSGRIRGGATFTEASNSLFQGLAADGGILAFWRASYECYCEPSSPLYGCRLNAFIHDEILGEAPIAQASAAAKRLEYLMVDSMQQYTPDIPSEAKPALMYCWAKGAEPVFNEHGDLVPWTKEMRDAA